VSETRRRSRPTAPQLPSSGAACAGFLLLFLMSASAAPAAVSDASAPKPETSLNLPLPKTLPPGAALAGEATFAPGAVDFKDGVLTVRTLGLSLPLGAGWVQRMPEGARATLDNMTLQARIQLSVADLSAGEGLFTLKSAVLVSVEQGGSRVDRSGQVSYAGLPGQEGWGDSILTGKMGPREQVRVHMVGLLGHNRAYFFIVKALKGGFDPADQAFVAALKGMSIRPPGASKEGR